jgi:hypothetical protein
MQTLPLPNLLATHQPSTRQPERRMADRNRRPDSGERNQYFDCPLAQLGPMVAAIRGRMGNRVYKTYGEKIIITRVPSFEGYVPTAAQRDRRNRMRAATAFAQAVYADPAAKAVYVAAARALGRQPFRLAVSDFLHGRTRITPAVPCPAMSPATRDDRAQGSRAAGVRRRGSRRLIPDPTSQSCGCTRSTVSTGAALAKCRSFARRKAVDNDPEESQSDTVRITPVTARTSTNVRALPAPARARRKRGSGRRSPSARTSPPRRRHGGHVRCLQRRNTARDGPALR